VRRGEEREGEGPTGCDLEPLHIHDVEKFMHSPGQKSIYVCAYKYMHILYFHQLPYLPVFSLSLSLYLSLNMCSYLSVAAAAAAAVAAAVAVVVLGGQNELQQRRRQQQQ